MVLFGPAALNEFVQKHPECVWALVSRRKRKEEEKVSQKTVERGQKGKIFMPRVFFCFVVREKDKLCFGAEGEGGGDTKIGSVAFWKQKRERKGRMKNELRPTRSGLRKSMV